MLILKVTQAVSDTGGAGQDSPEQAELNRLLDKFMAERLSAPERARLTDILAAIRDDRSRGVRLVGGHRLAAAILLRVIRDMG